MDSKIKPITYTVYISFFKMKYNMTITKNPWCSSALTTTRTSKFFEMIV